MSLPNVPRIRQGKPKPFQRKSVTVSGGEVKRAWAHVLAETIEVGDILAEHGVVKRMGFAAGVVSQRVFMECGEPDTHTVERRYGDEVYAFTRVRDGN